VLSREEDADPQGVSDLAQVRTTSADPVQRFVVWESDGDVFSIRPKGIVLGRDESQYLDEFAKAKYSGDSIANIALI
jgi:hypothetical protein